MSAREWRPGDVALFRVERWSSACEWPDDTSRVLMRLDDDGLFWSAVDGDPAAPFTVQAGRDELHPLVVIDPEDREQVALLLSHYHSWKWTQKIADASITDMQAALRGYANPTPPPRIDEPGTWGVVEASCVHRDRRGEWIHHPDGNWWPAFDYSTVPERTPLPDDWDSLIDPVLVREGVDS